MKKKKICVFFLALTLLLSGCNESPSPSDDPYKEPESGVTDLGDDNKSFGDSLDELGVYNGYFEEGNATVKMPGSMNAIVIALGDASARIAGKTNTSQALNKNGVAWH